MIARLGLKRRYNEADGRFEFGNVWLADELRPLGNSLTKYVPEYVQDLCPRQLRIFLDAYLAGDGHFGSCVEYSTSSKRLAYDIQLICMKLGRLLGWLKTCMSETVSGGSIDTGKLG